jgi:hypothetical protein
LRGHETCLPKPWRRQACLRAPACAVPGTADRDTHRQGGRGNLIRTMAIASSLRFSQ